jgi:ATPase subunit of ABC transporter with duplicated ATPase domains
MRQFIGKVRDDTSVARPARLASPRADPAGRAAVETAELAMMERDDEPAQMAYAQALADWADAGGYEHETLWDVCTVARSASPFEQAQWRDVRTLSGGEQKRLVLEALLRGPDEVLLLDEPDNYLDVPAKRWLEERAVDSPKTVLFVSHDRELLDRVRDPDRDARAAAAGSTSGCTRAASRPTRRPAATGSPARGAAPRWDEEHAKLKALV